MRPAANDLGRFERMAHRAKQRSDAVSVEERRRDLADQAERIRGELLEAQERYLAGPPDGCVECYGWDRRSAGLVGSWHWWHHPPEEDLWTKVRGGELPEDVLTCQHYCHGPDGYPRPILLFA